MLYVIAAASHSMGIGYKNNLPWTEKLSIDMLFFRLVTSHHSFGELFPTLSFQPQSDKQHFVVMGRKTFDSLNGFQLTNRQTVVLSRNTEYQNSLI